MFITLLVLLVFAVAITVGIMSLKDTVQDPVKFKNRAETLEALSIVICIILFILIIVLWWRVPNGSAKAMEPPIMKAPTAEAPLAVIPPLVSSPTAVAIIATPTVVPEEEVVEFGGVKIDNPSKQPFAIKLYDNEKETYVEYRMVNKRGEEVRVSWDEKYVLEAADAETYFEGYVQVGDQKYDFMFDSAKDGKSVKELKI